MENPQQRIPTRNAEELAELNRFNANYSIRGLPLNKQAIATDYELLCGYKSAYQNRHVEERPSVGDALLLPDGQMVYFCETFDHDAQTSESGSFYLSSSGYISYSGGMDSGISYSDIVRTNDKSALQVWFAHRGSFGPGSAVYANIECRVWETKAGADLSGIPQVKRLKKKLLKAKSETITKIDGNGRAYQEHLPEIVIRKENLPADLLDQIKLATGLDFIDDIYYHPVYWTQPMALNQIKRLKTFSQLKVSLTRSIINCDPILVFEMKN